MLRFISILILAVVLVAVIFFCSRTSYESDRVSKQISNLRSPVDSGYDASMTNWTAFADCWQEKSKALGLNYEIDQSMRRWRQNPVDGALVARQIQTFEQQIGKTLPKSYVDFMLATNGQVDNHTHGISEQLLMFDAGSISFFKEARPDSFAVWADFPHTDETVRNYFEYGDKQTPTGIIATFLRDAVLLGESDFGHHLLIVPAVSTVDGEWEAWHLGPSFPGAIRYPSFAHLVREVAFADVGGPKFVGPHPASALRSLACTSYVTVR
jgi:hypothetical protein